ncbi:mas-related G-protein coupled receptor member X1-like [Octodon degus]|uniref:Mas-related G-protein coupled receptor member X1-like n=1 Tax=Octodon degus TaxID=10160 RepID=A0A6P3FMA9_OCTDE|nr:mas-related G-protein coupled receptor member X1-like [Octodon degus]
MLIPCLCSRSTSGEPLNFCKTRPTPTNGSALDMSINVMFLTMTLVDIITSLVGLVGNTVVLWLLGFRMHGNTVSVYVLNLAAADFLFLCGHIADSVNSFLYFFHLTSIIVPQVISPLMICFYITGLSMLSAISTERCLSVQWPIWYRHHRPRHMSAVTCALLWSISLLLSILVLVYCNVEFKFYFSCLTMSFIIAAWLIFLFLVLCGSSLALLLRMLCGSRRLPLTRLYVTVGLSVLVSLLCGLPIGIMHSLLSWFTDSSDWIYYDLTAFFLSGINSSANPLIYFFVGSFKHKQKQRQQQFLKLILEKALENKAEVDRSRDSLPQNSIEISGSLSFSDSIYTRVNSQK